jgi:hypothetical protein
VSPDPNAAGRLELKLLERFGIWHPNSCQNDTALANERRYNPARRAPSSSLIIPSIFAMTVEDTPSYDVRAESKQAFLELVDDPRLAIPAAVKKFASNVVYEGSPMPWLCESHG